MINYISEEFLYVVSEINDKYIYKQFEVFAYIDLNILYKQ